MKKIIQIVVGFIALGFLVVIAKNSLFTDSNTDFYEKGCNAYEEKNYDAAIFFFNHVDKEKYPEVLLYLGSSYLNKEDFENSKQNFQEAYQKGIGKGTEDYKKLLNNLGLSYMYTNNFKKSRYFLENARKAGNPNITRNIQILDSLEQLQNKNLNTGK